MINVRKADKSDAAAIGQLNASLAPNIRIGEETQYVAEQGGKLAGSVRLPAPASKLWTAHSD